MRRTPPAVRPLLPALALLAVLAGSVAVRAAPGPQDDVKKAIGEAAGKGDWSQVAVLMAQLAHGGNAETWRFLARVAEQAPPASQPDCATALRAAAQTMTDRRVQEEVKKTALHSHVAVVRRELALHLATLQDWPSLIALLGDDDEQTASTAAWRLIDNKVEAAVEPMISQMEKLDRSHAGIWDVFRNGLGRLLGQRLESGAEYRSRWTTIKGQGGLASVHTDPAAAPVETGGGGDAHTAVRLFGRTIDCSRVVFILDVSGSMTAIDPGQEPDPGSRARDPSTPTVAGAPPQPVGKTRIVRAQEELKRVLGALPESTKVNIVAYSSRVQLWKASENDAPPPLVPMTAANKTAACAFVDQFQANGVTVTDDALRRAFDVVGARCFYLLSDGAATHDGTTPVPTADILRVVDELGKDAHITIHTLGFVGADKEMMTTLAEHTGGMYSDIK